MKMNYLVDTKADETRQLTLAARFVDFVDVCTEDKLFDKDDLIQNLNTLNYLYLNGWRVEKDKEEGYTSGLLSDVFGDSEAEIVDNNELVLIAHRLGIFALTFLRKQGYTIDDLVVVGVNYEDQGLAYDIDYFSIVIQEAACQTS